MRAGRVVTRVLLLALPFLVLHSASAQEICFFKDEAGVIKQVASQKLVPAYARATAKCFRAPTQAEVEAARPKGRQVVKPSNLADPDKIELGNQTRREVINSSLGTIELSWPRSAEKLFGRSPLRAMTDAARAAAKAISRANFPSGFNTRDLPWKIVFMDADLPASQIPTALRQGCHRGWMTPPANVYLVTSRIATRCGYNKSPTTGVADSELAEVLVHEIGHVVEYRLQGKKFYADRVRAEGFATWFESVAADYSKFIPSGSVRSNHFAMAKKALRYGNRPFSGTGEDYAKASLIFHAVVDRRGTSGLFRIYEELQKNGGDFKAALKAELGWSDRKISEEMLGVLD